MREVKALARLLKCTDSSELALLARDENTFHCVSMPSKCTYVLNGRSKCSVGLLKCADSPGLSLLAHAIKTTIVFVSLSSKCTFVLNGSSKGSCQTAQMRRLV